MQTLETLKRSIRSAEDLAGVVRTMKTLAAVSIRQFEQAAESLADYARTIELGLRMALWNSPDPPARGPEPDDDLPTGAVLLGSDQGMCGQFNEQIVAYALEEMARTRQGRTPWSFLAVGVRGEARLLDQGMEVDETLSLPSSAAGVADLVVELLAALDRWKQRRRLHKILIVYNRRRSASSYQPHHQQLFPIPPSDFARNRRRRWDTRTLPMHTLPRDALLHHLVRQQLFVTLFRACAESLAGENASRIASMQSAEKNIQERLLNLQADYHQQRQNAITEEILDVVTGYEALHSTRRG